MTITKDEFKQLYQSFIEADTWYNNHQEVLNDNVCDKLLNPYYEVFDMLDIGELVGDFYIFGKVPSKWIELEDGEVEVIETTSDLDVFYDVWIAN